MWRFTRHRFFGAGLIRWRHEKSVGQRNGFHIIQIRIVADRRIDEKGDWHVHGFAWLQGLFRKAETLDLIEIPSGLLRRDIECRNAGDVFFARIVRAIKRQGVLADFQAHFALHGLETPRQILAY